LSRPQYAFLIAVLLVWLAWAAGWVVVAAVAAGLIAWQAIRLLQGEIDVQDLQERFRTKK
jgi:protein-S-isoprenylcysteine O-methyltransferase Ste14